MILILYKKFQASLLAGYNRAMDNDLLEAMNRELDDLYNQADFMEFWPSHFDGLIKSIQDRYRIIQDERIDEILLK